MTLTERESEHAPSSRQHHGRVSDWVLPVLLSSACGAAFGYIDLRIDEVFFVALLACSGAMVLALIWPRFGWLWGVLMGLGVAAAHILARAAHVYTELPNNIGASLLVTVPAVVGGVAGTVMRFLGARLRE